MSVNAINRVPIPGSYGAPVDQGVSLTLQITGGGNIPLASLILSVNSVVAYSGSALKNNFTGTIVTDGSSGWNIHLVPPADFSYNSAVTVQANCTEQPSGTPFSQTYSFTTIRNIDVGVNAEYLEDSDTLTLEIYANEGQNTVPAVVTNITANLYGVSYVEGAPNTLIDTYSLFNDRNSLSADGMFYVRFIHPLAVKEDMRYEVLVSFDQYQAPGLGTVTSSGSVIYTHKPDARVINGNAQPYPQGEIHKPRVEYDGNSHKKFQINQADYQKVDFAGNNNLPDILVDIDFTAGKNYSNVLSGDVSYSGGGSRLLKYLDDNTKYLLQDVNDFPPSELARTVVEPECINIFPNSSFIGISSSPFTTYGTDSKVIATSELADFIVSSEDEETPVVNQLKFVFEGMSYYDGVTRHACGKSPSVLYTTGQDVLISSLIRITYRDSTVTLTNFKFIAQFYDIHGAVVYSSNTTYDPTDFVSGNVYSLAEAFVPSSSVPGTAISVGFVIDFDSFESCDRIEVYMVGPCIEYGTSFATSRVVSKEISSSRLNDLIEIDQRNNINIQTGMFAVSFSPTYDNAPPEDAYLFDTRNVSSLTNGFSAVHKTSGVVEFTVTDTSGVTQTVSSSPINLPIGEGAEFSFAWSDGSIVMKQGSTTIGSFSGAYTLPLGINTSMKIGTDANNDYPLLSEITKFRIYSRPVT